MGEVKQLKTMVALVAISTMMMMMSSSTEAAEATHHVVGGDRGWEPSSNLSSWSNGRIFRVGDKIWFTYSAAHGSILELRSREEYEACDVRNPIQMLTDGLNTISLDGEGFRYFASSKPENCKTGLKLHIEVLPEPAKIEKATDSAAADHDPNAAIAAAPAIPSGSAHATGVLSLFLAGLLICIVGLVVV